MHSKTITVQLKRSIIGSSKQQKSCIRGLGLKKMHSKKTLENTPAVRGMIKKAIHFLDIKEESNAHTQ